MLEAKFSFSGSYETIVIRSAIELPVVKSLNLFSRVNCLEYHSIDHVMPAKELFQ